MVPDSRKKGKKKAEEQLHLEQRRAYRVRGWGTGCDKGDVYRRFIGTKNRAGQDWVTGEVRRSRAFSTREAGANPACRSSPVVSDGGRKKTSWQISAWFLTDAVAGSTDRAARSLQKGCSLVCSHRHTADSSQTFPSFMYSFQR